MYIFPIQVEFEDVDSYGVMHHPKVLCYFERARMHYLLENNINISERGVGTLIRDVAIQYRSPLLLAEQVKIEIVATCVERYRFALEYAVKKADGKIAIRAKTELCTIDLATKKLTPIPDYLDKLLRDILVKETV